MTPGCQCLVDDALKLIEAEGPTVVGALLNAVAPGLPVGIIVALLDDLAKYVQDRRALEERQAMQAGAAAADARVDAAEAAQKEAKP